MNAITRIEAEAQVRRLTAAGYNVPRSTDPERIAGAWAETMRDVSGRELEAAVTSYLRDGGRFWPNPAELHGRAIAARKAAGGTVTKNDLRSRYLAWEQHHGDGSPCPVCGAVLQLAGDPKRYDVLHDEGKHAKTGVPFVGTSRADRQMYHEMRKARLEMEREKREQREARKAEQKQALQELQEVGA